MKKKLTSVITMCMAASLIFATSGAVAFADDGGAGEFEPVDQDTGSQDTGSQDTGSQGAGSQDTGSQDTGSQDTGSQDTGSQDTGSSGQRTLVSVNTYYDCDGSGNGYYEYVYSDGSVEYEDFRASSGSSSGSSDSYSDSSSESADANEEVVVEETVIEEETASEEPVEEEELDCVEWTMDEIASIPDVVFGVEDKEYAANSAHKYDIHMDVDFDKDIVDGVLFNTSKIDFSTSGEYNMTYFVYFNREALLDYIEENDLNEEDFPGLSDETEDRFEIGVKGTVTIN